MSEYVSPVKGILLGFEVGTGKPVYLRLHHLVITGMTALSGKTTTLEALIYRSGLKAIAFITKRGEVGFQEYHEIPAYFKERSDWQYVESLIEATLRENQRFNRSWIIRACRGTKVLKDVLQNLEQLKAKARKGSLAESVYINLAEYLKLVIPQIKKFSFSDQITLQDGINVMDLSEMTLEMRSLVIRSVMEYGLEKLSNTIIIVPEAWEFLPQFRSTPVKFFAESFIRKGAAVGNYLWVDSQDIAGIDKTPLRQCDNWILGRQKDVREVRRTREEIFKNTPTEHEIMTLSRGHFYACIGNEVHLVYVQPSWLGEEAARDVALGKVSVETVYKGFLESRKESDEDLKWKEKFEKLEKDFSKLKETLITTKTDLENARIELAKKVPPEEIELLRKRITQLEHEKAKLTKSLNNANAVLEKIQDDLELLDELRMVFGKLAPTMEPKIVEIPAGAKTTLDLEHREMVVNVSHRERPVKLTTETQQGQIMYVALHDVPEARSREQGFTEAQISKALKERGWNIPHSSLAPTLGSTLAKQGLLIKVPKTRPQKYRLPSKVKINVED